MRPRNEVLHAEIDRIVDLKLQIPSCKTIADKHHTSPQTIRVLISRALRARKLTNVKLHVEQD
jgi:DNA-binding CsgD family transcriptional regulator